jgi:hypothetical protein
VTELTSCLDFQLAKKSVAKHRVPNGLGGVHVDFKMQGNLKITLTPTQGKPPLAMEFAPSKNALGEEELVLWFGRFAPPCNAADPGCSYDKGEVLADFARFYSLLQKPPETSKRVMPVNASERDEACPGSQCPSIRIWVPKK